MSESDSSAMRDGEVQLGDGVGLVTHGDLLMVLYAADAHIKRSEWLFARAERLIARSANGIVGLVIIPQSSKPPNAATRAAETQFYTRVGASIRRVVTVPEGNPFFVSIVRLVVSAHIAIQGKRSLYFFAKDLEDGIRLAFEAKTESTPNPTQIRADIMRLRAGLSAADQSASA